MPGRYHSEVTGVDHTDQRVRNMLAGHPFVRGLEPDDVEVFADLGRLVEFAPGQIIFASGDGADVFYLVKSGVVSLQVDAGGPYPRTVQNLHEGAALGWSWLFPPYVWQFDAVAQTPVRTIGFDAAELRNRFEEQPATGYRVMARVAEVMSERLHATRHQLLDLALS